MSLGGEMIKVLAASLGFFISSFAYEIIKGFFTHETNWEHAFRDAYFASLGVLTFYMFF